MTRERIPYEKRQENRRAVPERNLRRTARKRAGEYGTWSYVPVYTVCFLFTAAIVFSAFYLNGKTFVWDSDGVTQHFNALLYYRSWLREFLHSLFVEHRLEIPLWDLKIGYGSDILTTLHYYAYGDPLNLFSVFVPKEAWMDEFYTFLILLRIYLAGLTFSYFCFQRKEEKTAILMGALLYAFSFWTIYAAVRHPYFMNPMIYFPLVLAGADRIFRKKRPFLYIFSLAAAILSNFYFGYMTCILVILYCIFRYRTLFGKFQWKKLAVWAGRFFGYSIPALMLACVLLVPVALCAVSSGRLSQDRWIPLFYSASYYKSFLSAFLYGEAGNWSEMGYTAYGLLGIFLLFLQKKKNTALKIGYLLLTVFLLLPLAGYAMNGFSYAANRFAWSYAMLVAYIFVHTWKDLVTLSDRQKKLLLIAGAVYLVLCLAFEESRTEAVLGALVLFAILLLWLLSAGIHWIREKKIRLFRTCAVLGLIACLGFQGIYRYSPSEEGYVGEFTENNGAYLNLTAYSPSTAAAGTGDTSFWRYDQYGTETWQYHNANVALGLNSVTYYWSLSDPSVFQFQKEMYLNLQRNFLYQNLDGRSFLDALSGVKYFVVASGGECYLPYGFSQNVNTVWVGEDAQTALEYEAAGRDTSGLSAVKASVYGTDNSLPLAYTYDRWISREEYEKLSVTEKQQALLQGIVLEDSTLPAAAPVFDDQVQDCQVQFSGKIEQEDGGLLVREAGASMTLTFAGMPESETYLIFEGLDYEGIRPSDCYTQEEWAKLSSYEKNQVKQQDSRWTAPDATTLSVYGNGIKNLSYLNERNSFYSGLHDYLVNAGYSDDGLQTITVVFQKEGHYSFEDYSVVCQPVENLGGYVEERNQNILEQVEVGTNRISGEIRLDQAKALCITIPYSEGWTATVDGVETELKRANTMFMALELEPGSHEIVLTYRTPGLTAGAALTLGGCVVCAVLWRLDIVRRRRNRNLRRRK